MEESFECDGAIRLVELNQAIEKFCNDFEPMCEVIKHLKAYQYYCDYQLSNKGFYFFNTTECNTVRKFCIHTLRQFIRIVNRDIKPAKSHKVHDIIKYIMSNKLAGDMSFDLNGTKFYLVTVDGSRWEN